MILIQSLLSNKPKENVTKLLTSSRLGEAASCSRFAGFAFACLGCLGVAIPATNVETEEISRLAN
jgi:hypothetical protein